MKKFSEYKVRVPDIKKVAAQMDAFTEEFKAAKTFEEALKVFLKADKYTEGISSDTSVINVKYTLNVTDEKIVKAMDYLDNALPLLTEPSIRYNQAILASPFLDDFRKKFGDHLIKMIEVSLKTQSPDIIPEKIELNRLDSEYSRITGTAEIPFRGQIYNLSTIGKFSNDLDRNTRKEAAYASAKWFSDHDEELGRIYDQMVKTRDRMAKKLGYQNYVELGYLNLNRTDYDATMVKAYREQIKEVAVPLSGKLIAAQKKRLGLSKLYSYDLALHFPDGNPVPNGTPDELLKKAQEMYREIGPETGDFFDLLYNNELLDVLSRPGKAPGGYMTSFGREKVPFIFANFNGTQHDVEVLTHEFGHAFQYYLSRNIKPGDYISPTLEACEIHSMSMEFLTWPWMKNFFDDEVKFKKNHLEGAITFLPYGALVDEFQHFVYENPNIGHEERKAKWSELEKVYQPYKDYEKIDFLKNGGFWTRQGHIFSNPFYYIDYTLAQVVAFQFFIESQKDAAKAWKKYLKLCRLGGKYPFTELLVKAKLRVPFDEGSIKKTFTPLKKILNNL